jgi:hypothetical protein
VDIFMLVTIQNHKLRFERRECEYKLDKTVSYFSRPLVDSAAAPVFMCFV